MHIPNWCDGARHLPEVIMAHGVIVVKAAHDPEAGVWFVQSSDIPGLNAEADTLENLKEKLPNLILDLVSASYDDDGEGDDGSHDREVPIEVIAYASTRVRIRDAAA
jgi:predicted RNase H-like HicB family nuclease